MSPLTVGAAVERFLAFSRATNSPATVALYAHYLRKFVTHSGEILLKRVTPAGVLAWSPLYHPIAIVQRLCAWATHEARLIDCNPLEGMRKHRNGHRRRILARGERVRLLRCLKPAARRLAVGLAESMARPRELREARWCDLRTSGSPAWSVADLVAGRCFLWVDRFKAQKLRRDREAVRIIPISPRLGRLLARRYVQGPECNGLLFLNSRGRPWTSAAVRLQFVRVRGRAALTADGAGENVVAYTLRHTAATDAVGAGVKAFTLAEMMGHSDIRMTQRYVHLHPEHLLEARRQIDQWRKNDRLGLRRKRPD